jgi:hypothetical protein
MTTIGPLIRSYTRLMVAVVIVVGVIAGVHYYMTTNLVGASLLKTAYVHRYLTRKNWPWFDIMWPEFVLAVITAKLLYNCHYLNTIVAVLIEHIILVACLVLYARWLSPAVCYWWPRDSTQALLFLFDQLHRNLLYFVLAALAVRLSIRNSKAPAMLFRV